MFIVENLASTRNFMDRGAWQATAHGATKVIHNYMTEQEKCKKKETTAPPPPTHTPPHTFPPPGGSLCQHLGFHTS